MIFILFFVFLGSCSRLSKDEVNDLLMGGSFLVINQKHDTIQIEFLDNCVKTYSWDYYIYQEWGVSEQENSIFLFFDGQYFKLKSRHRNKLIFTNDKTDLILVKIERIKINPEYIKGKWIEDKYSYILSDTINLPPPCISYFNDTFLIPGLEFRVDSCISNDFCNKKETIYKANLNFGIIRFDDYCTSQNQLRVIKLTKDTLIVNSQHYINNEINYEENKIYVRPKAKKQ